MIHSLCSWHSHAEVSGWHRFQEAEATAATTAKWLSGQVALIKQGVAGMQNASASDTAKGEAEAARDAAQAAADAAAGVLRQRLTDLSHLVRLRRSALSALQGGQEEEVARLQAAAAHARGTERHDESMQARMVCTCAQSAALSVVQ